MDEEYRNSPKSKSKFILPIILIALVAIGAAGTYYFYTQYQKSQKLLKDPTAAQQEEMKETLGKLSKLMDLPQGEDPQIATILDKDKLKDQAFFAKAENGDKVIIYTKAGKAILFRPSTNKIIDIGPINLGSSQEKIKIAVYNGTKTAGATTKFADEIAKIASNVDVVLRTNAARNDYSKSLVIDLTGQKGELAAQMAKAINADVASLPEGETKPTDTTIDLLIILGETSN
ncbi:MAG TPA: LytR C-terminal domain-containing protein [Alphaproteobacteria bacterium]|jgi:hypothetical protein|nr:LytR C-terminal domain-containing protein [Alphaproteobacteria bacterium]